MRAVRKARNAVSFDHELGRVDDATYRERMDEMMEVEGRIDTALNRRWVETVEKD